MLDATQNVALVNAALAQSAIERARRVQRLIEAETRDLGLTVGLYPSIDVDFIIAVEAPDGEWIGELECTYHESGRDWLRGARAVVALHRHELANRRPSADDCGFGFAPSPN